MISKTSQIVNASGDSFLNEISVYPNPFNKSFSVRLPAGQEMSSLQIYSMDGVLMKQYSSNKTKFFWPEVAKGIYILRIKTNSSVLETKIVKN
jgi:hypothetical protein